MPKFQKHKQESILKSILNNKKNNSVNDPERLGNFQISLQYYNDNQPTDNTLKVWESSGLLADALEVLSGYCKRPLREQIDGKKFSVYQGFPKKDQTEFTFPNNVPEDAQWARIHIKGKPVVIGHIVGNTFYIVFFDKDHRFGLTKRETDN